jgi:hypothetical protein
MYVNLATGESERTEGEFRKLRESGNDEAATILDKYERSVVEEADC